MPLKVLAHSSRNVHQFGGTLDRSPGGPRSGTVLTVQGNVALGTASTATMPSRVNACIVFDSELA